MNLIADKVEKSINEQSDFAVYAIKSKISITNTQITQNDFFLSASTESIVSLKTSNITNLLSSGKMIQSVFSTIELDQVLISDIQYNKSVVPSFYKMSIESESTFKASNVTMQRIDGLLLYVSDS
jgi:hypothetical protein